MSRFFEGAAANRLAGNEIGHGARTALLLHGGGQTRHAWAKTAHSLADRRWRVVAIDQRGHGDSEWIAEGAYAFPDYAADAAAVARQIAAEHGARPVAVGASLGGIASLLALGRAEEEAEPPFAGLVLVDVVPKMDPAGVESVQLFMRARVREGFASVEEAAEAVAAYLPHRPRPRSLDGLKKNLRLHPDGRWRWHWDPRFLDGPRPVGTDRERVRDALERAARTLAVPTLLVRGGSSELVSEAAAQTFLAATPSAEYADVADARHMVAGDRNDAFTAAILAFLERRFPAEAGADAAE